MNEQFILLNHPEGDQKFFVGAIPPPPDEAVYAAVIQDGETTTTNLGRCILMFDEMIQEAERRGLPDDFPVALMREGKDCGLGTYNLGDLKDGFFNIINGVWPDFKEDVDEYRRLKAS